MNTSIWSAVLFILASLTAACSEYTADAAGEEPCDTAGVVPPSQPSVPTPPKEEAPQPSGASAPAPASEPSEPCDTTLKVDVWRPNTHSVKPGDTGLTMMTLTLTAPKCASLWVNSIGLRMIAPLTPPNNLFPICAQYPCLKDNDFIFKNWKVLASDGAVLAVSTDTVSSLSTKAPWVTLNSSFKMDPGQVVNLTVTADLDVKSTAPWHDVAFRTSLGTVNAGTTLDITDYQVTKGSSTTGIIWVTPPSN